MIACASGCTIRRRHLADCGTEDGDTTADACPGCLPRPASDGSTVCIVCDGRWTDALTRAPELVTHIRSLIEPGSAGPSEAQWKHTKGAAAPAPLNVAAVSDADDLHAVLASWAARVVDESGMHGPHWSGSDVRPASRRRTCGGVAYEDARVVGLTAGTDGAATREVAGWLLTHRAWILSREWVPVMVQEVSRMVGQLRARWPVEERPARLPIRCPECGQRALTRYAPREAGWPSTITCDECGQTIPEQLYGHYARLVLAEQRKPRPAGATPEAEAS